MREGMALTRRDYEVADVVKDATLELCIKQLRIAKETVHEEKDKNKDPVVDIGLIGTIKGLEMAIEIIELLKKGKINES